MSHLEIEGLRVDEEEADGVEEVQPQDIGLGHLEDGLDIALAGQVTAEMLEGGEEALEVAAPGPLFLEPVDAGAEEIGIDGVVVHPGTAAFPAGSPGP